MNSPVRRPFARAALPLGAGVLAFGAVVWFGLHDPGRNAPEPSPGNSSASPAPASVAASAEPRNEPPAPIPGGWRVASQNLERKPGLENWVVLIERNEEPRRLVAVSTWHQDPEDGTWREDTQNVYVADQIRARPLAGVPNKDLRALFADYGLRVRQEPVAPDFAWVLEWDQPSPERFTEIYHELNARTDLLADATPIAADFQARVVEQVRR